MKSQPCFLENIWELFENSDSAHLTFSEFSFIRRKYFQEIQLVNNYLKEVSQYGNFGTVKSIWKPLL